MQAQAIPDHFLALGLDRLARDVDEKSQALVMIDYKDLGVRHLGSIYEGLLEFKLRVAQEKLAIVRQKGREVYIPVAEISKSRRTYGEIAKGEVYLENDKRERKATGSYYTPDYIVKYIVEHTVGPVLERKFEELEPRLREAQRRYRQHKKRVEARGNDQPPELWWKDDDEAQRLADDCLNLRCLDPAMGSGHFLVEVVDFVSNRLLDFLNAWSENPVWAMLERMREEILADVEAQGVSIDAGKLTRVALLKRAVLKRCIYGVDLNEMAVELAKVSLWLDAFTLGAPLSFLDHHLKQGNSLIGARVKEVQDALEGKANQAVQMSLFGTSKFAGVMLATELMRQVSYLSDNTVAQVQESRKAYRDARDQLAPFKRILDVYTSRWFGNEPGKGGFDPTIEFLQREDTQRWLEDLETPLPEKDYLNVGQVAETALEAAEEKRFFHWELEFPEVFFAPRTRDGQDVELLEDGGFDAVVGNPPYDELSEDALGRPIDEREYLTNASIFEPAQASGGRLNWYHFFMVLGIRLLKPRGRASFIVPMSWMGDSFTFGVRKWLLSHHVPIVVEAFPQKDNPYERVFFEAKLPTSIFIAEKNNVSKSISVRVHPGRDILSQPHYQADLSIIKSLENWIIPLVSRREWDVLSKLLSDDGLGTIADDGAEPTSGEIIFNKATRPYLTDDGAYDLILRGSHVQRYELASKAKQGEPVYLKKAAYLKDSQDGSKAFAHQQPRVVYQEGSAIDAWRRVVPTYLPAGYICGHKICYFTDYKVDHLTLLAIFGSNLINWLVERLSTTNSLPAYLIGNLPFPRFHDTQDASNQRAIIEAIRHSYRANNYDAVLQDLKNSLTPNNIAITHDALSFLAQMMIELNQEKQQEASRFISWLEKVLQILPRKGKTGIEALTGYTIIQNYLGDYQKGEKELPWSEMEYRLYSNRSRFQANWEKVKGQVQTEYEKSLETLRPIKQQLAETDALIDKIVYKLYGLTEEEIALIEQPQYEQALQEAKEAVRGDKKLQKDPDKAADVIAEKVLPAAERFQQRVAHDEERRRLDRDLPGWHMFPADVQTFLLTGEYNIRSLPDHLDFSASVISYAKAVETVLFERLFVGFRDAARDGGRQTADGNVRNKFLKEFVEGTRRHLTLGSMAIILSSSKEKALRAFALATFPVGEERLFGDEGVAGLLNDDTVIHLRNKAAHDEVLTKEEAKAARAWAVGVLGNL